MTVVYPSLESSEFEADFQSVVDAIAALSPLFDELAVEWHDTLAVDEEILRSFETVIQRYSDVVERLSVLDAYIVSFVETDSRDEVAQATMSELEQHGVALSQLGTRLTAWLGSMDVEELIDRSEVAAAHAFMLRHTKTEAAHLMSQAEEDLALEMNVTAGSAWSRLRETIESQLTVPIEIDGEMEELPVSVVHNMIFEPDRETRRRAYEAELAAWQRIKVPLAAALNSIKGETITLYTHRRWDSALDLALFGNVIDRETLDAMLEVSTSAFPDFRRYLRAKARALGIAALAWYDLYAPVGNGTGSWDFEEAKRFILDHFGTFSEKLRDYGERAFDERWIDAEPREGKSGSAFCLPLRADESRVLVNFTPTFDGISTLAHELGHGYHFAELSREPVLLREAPNTLAETASIFCEKIVREAALQQANEQDQLHILEAAIQDACHLVVDSSSCFLFEQRLLGQRRTRELSADELSDLSLQAQRDTYGDALDETKLHPLRWAVVPHFYDVEYPFYNFPYTFGLLFGLGLYARYRHDPGAFQVPYDSLLASTGKGDAASLCAAFDIDIRAPDFWRSSLDVIRDDIDRFESLVESMKLGGQTESLGS